jgi:hypothetical protein
VKHVLKLTDWKWVSGIEKEMMYKDSLDEWFVGARHDVGIGNTYIVEISDTPLRDGYRHIVKFV